MKKMPGFTLVIGKGKPTNNNKNMDGYGSDEVEEEEVQEDAGNELITALENKDAKAVFSAIKTIIELCE